MRIRVLESSLHLLNCTARIPFRFGMNTMTAAPQCMMRVLVETERGQRGEGFASDLLVPKWFEKNPDQPIEQDWLDLIDSAQRAGQLATQYAALDTVFGMWRRLYAQRVESADKNATDLLVRGHGVSLVERAAMDAACRCAGVGFFRALREDFFGFEPGSIDPALNGWSIADSIGPSPTTSAHVRHTVGLVDAICAGDVAQRVNDGLPESLEEDVERYGLTRFKIKLSGDADRDVDRLARIASVLETHSPSAQVTIDGNEQFASIEQLVLVFERLSETPGTRALLGRVHYVEQPLPRGVTFDADANAAMKDFRRFAPCIIDEADCDIDALPRAVGLGYRGISVKNCKGVFRALVNRGRCDLSSGVVFQSGEDLTNLPTVALQQDLATMSTLGLANIERNGHHYFRGLDHLPAPEQQAAIERHGDLYTREGDSIQLNIKGGMIHFGSIHACAGCGCDRPHALEAWTPIDSWEPDSVQRGQSL
jgi:hypothetical protein